ncbi:seminal fluid protein [Pelomyxa schiedti]|nr:seminal fluid protein [Pelomyxa schiedti]
MKGAALLLLVLLCVVSALKTPAPHAKGWFHFPQYFNRMHKPLRDVEPQWFDQKQDHFDPTNKVTWKQLYYVNDEWFDGTGPVFFYFNGEGPLSPSAVTSDYFVTELAHRYGALLVSHEHRYYGQSFPVPDLSTANMKYLTVEQALEDAAYFQEWMMDTWNLTTNPWVITGGSYSGFLATAYRVRYPHLVMAAYSSSGVVLPIVDYYQYFEVVDQDFSWYPNCYTAMLNISAEISAIWNSGPSGLATLTDMFALCEPLVPADEVDFWETIISPSAGGAQYGYTKDVCAVVLGAPTPLQGWALFFKQAGAKFAGIDWATSCNNIHWTDEGSNITITKPYTGWRTWVWQTCIEFGWFQTTTTSQMWPHVIDLQYNLDGCDVLFGPGFYPDTEQIITDYGGLHPESDQIVSCAGLADPWHPACQLSTYKDTEPVYFIQGHDASHCKDMDAPSDKDSPEMTEARAGVQYWLDTWLNYKA